AADFPSFAAFTAALGATASPDCSTRTALLQSTPTCSRRLRAESRLASTRLPCCVISPYGSYPKPDTSYREPPLHRWVTVILFWVSVPVLSEQITDAQPKVSTEGSLRTIALRLIIRCTPRARAMVTIAGRPSGIAATAR